MSHSKRNTSRPDFTQHERSLLRSSWGSQRARLTRDSYLPFGSCRLCLLPAREPIVACARSGDLFCRECAVRDLLAQRKEIGRLERERERGEEGKRAAEEREKEEERQREVEKFERVIIGGEGGVGKRKRDGEVNREQDGKRRQLLGEGDEKKVEKSSSFWIPGSLSTTSSNAFESATLVKLHPIFSFTKDRNPKNSSPSESATLICPSCKKSLCNTSTKAILTKPCGHVICKPCADQFMKPALNHDPHSTTPEEREEIGAIRCYVCEADVTERPVKAKKGKDGSEKEKDKVRPGIIEISCEGTGFAGVGTNMTKRDGVAFLG
ncbi:MAG: hypothetical protein Q9160_006632 [Pyrenula sp. 1 TL-2023]